MPFEVREIAIQMQVGDRDQPAPSGVENLAQEEREAIIEDCVQRVLAMLKSQQER